MLNFRSPNWRKNGHQRKFWNNQEMCSPAMQLPSGTGANLLQCAMRGHGEDPGLVVRMSSRGVQGQYRFLIRFGREFVMLRTILLIVLVLLLLGALPTWPYSTGWGYYPSGGLGLILLIVVILIFAKRI